MGTAIFADRLGLDTSMGWGIRRIALLIFGAIMVLGSLLYLRFTKELQHVASKTRHYLEDLPLVPAIRRNTGIADYFRLFKKYWFTLPILLLVTLVYIWFISSGTWFSWVSPTHYYADLARGFLKGNLYLPIKVNPSLLTHPPIHGTLPFGRPLKVQRIILISKENIICTGGRFPL